MTISHPSLLYVEDDPLSREIVQMIVDHLMPETSLTIFTNSERFLDRLIALPRAPDLIMLDIHIEPLSGYELIQLIRSESAFQKVRIIAMTASVMKDEMDMLKKYHFDGAITKPFQIGKFPQLIARILNGERIWHIM